MKARTTLKLTSASRSATRTSRSASWMFSSDSRPRPPSLSKMACSLVLRESSMGTPYFTGTSGEYQRGGCGARRLLAAVRDELHRRDAPLIETDVDLIEYPALGNPRSGRRLDDVEPRNLSVHRLVSGRDALRRGHVHLHRYRLRRHPHLTDRVAEGGVGQHRVRVVERVRLVAERDRLAGAAGAGRHDDEGSRRIRSNHEDRSLGVRATQTSTRAVHLLGDG